MELHNLKPAKGANHHDKRVGRGAGSGHGGYSTRGLKGAKSRSGYSRKLGFEGGQMPLARRIPKRGFHNKWAKSYVIINLSQLVNVPAGTEVDLGYVRLNGLAKEVKNAVGLKVLGNGELKAALTVKAVKFSESAKAAIEKAGGKAVVEE